ncbi:DUF1129 family protein [Lactobacillaceae bacterium Melli_B4]
MSNDNRKRNAAAAAQQKRTGSTATQEERNAFDNMGLTKRNADYMFRFKQKLDEQDLAAEKKRDTVDHMLAELKENQKSGATARNLYGTVEQRIDFIMNPPKEKETITTGYWPNAFYNFFVFFALFSLLYGITFLISKNPTQQQSASGIVGIFLIAAITGMGMPIITKLFDPNVKHTHSGWARAGLMLLMVLAWLILFYGVVLLPTAINPVLPPYVNIGLAVVSFGVSIWMHSKYTITTGLFTPRQPRNHK